MSTHLMRQTRQVAGLLCCLFLLLPLLQAPTAVTASADGGYIRWVDFTPTAQALSDAIALDVASHEEGKQVSAVTLLAIYATVTGGSFVTYKRDTLVKIADRLRSGEAPLAIAKNEKLFTYYCTAYGAVLD